MKFKGTTALLILFVALGGYVYFTEFRGREAREQAEAAKKKAVQVEKNNIVELSLLYPGTTITGVKKGEKQWELSSPAGIDADAEEWDRLASNLASLEREATVAENAANLAAFGLDSPPIKVTAKLADGKTIEIALGAENPGKNYIYAKLGDSNDVFLTPSSWKGLFTKTVNDLRDKKVIQVEADTDIDAIRIVEGARELELQKSGEDWLVKKPLEVPGDSTEIVSLVSSMRFARASSFAEPAVTAKAAGLDPPVMRITLHDAKAQADRALLIGRSPEPDKYYARDASRDAIMIIEKEVPDKARRPIFDWRDKRISTVQPASVDEVVIEAGADSFSFKKDGTDWKLPDGRKLQWDKATSMMTSLEFDRAADIIDAPKALTSYGLDKPKLQLIFRQGTSELARFAFGADSREPAGVYFKTSERPAVDVISRETFNKFNVKVDALVEPEATAPSAP